MRAFLACLLLKMIFMPEPTEASALSTKNSAEKESFESSVPSPKSIERKVATKTSEKSNENGKKIPEENVDSVAIATHKDVERLEESHYEELSKPRALCKGIFEGDFRAVEEVLKDKDFDPIQSVLLFHSTVYPLYEAICRWQPHLYCSQEACMRRQIVRSILGHPRCEVWRLGPFLPLPHGQYLNHGYRKAVIVLVR